MNCIETKWNGYKCLEFEFQNRKARLVCPKQACQGNKWLLKTEYFGAFPSFELEMLADGYHVAYVSNKTRWHDASDDDMKESFCAFLHQEFVKDTGLTKSDLINYRNHPIDQVDVLVRNKIPVFLVAGDNDTVVPYAENGKVLYEYYVEHDGDITQIVKQGCDHHPHGLADNALLKEFVNRVY